MVNSNDTQETSNSFQSQLNFMGFFHNPQQQVGETMNLSEESSPLGLTLRKTPSFLDLIESKLYQENPLPSSKTNLDKQTNDSAEQREKWKASNFNATFLKIGSWERVTRRDGDIVAKCYYSKRKLVWEILQGGLKSKLEIQFSDISAMRALFPENGHETLELEMKKAPIFFREINPQPRKHTIWQTSSDFTGGQATLNRRHYIRFAKGTLGKHYERLLQCDDRLFMLSKQGFPSYSSPYFHFSFGGNSDLPYEYEPQSPSFQHVPTYNPRVSLVTSMDIASPMSVMELSPPSEEHQRTFSIDKRPTHGENVHTKGENQSQKLPYASQNRVGNFLLRHRPSNQSVLNNLAEQLLYDPITSAACSDEQKLMARVNSMASLLQLQSQQTVSESINPYNIRYNVSSSNNQAYGDSEFISKEQRNWDCHMGYLQRNSSSFSYGVPNQEWDDSADEEIYYQ